MSLLHARRLRNGDRIRITWLPSCRNAPGTRNPYIGMEGTVEDLTRRGGLSFSLVGETSVLIVHGRFRYKRLEPKPGLRVVWRKPEPENRAVVGGDSPVECGIPARPEHDFTCADCGFGTDHLDVLAWHRHECPGR